MNNVKAKPPSGTPSEKCFTPEKKSQVINISLLAIQVVGLILLAASLPGSTQLIVMPDQLTMGLALGGTALLLGGSFFWGYSGYHQKDPTTKKVFYAITAIAVLTVIIGSIACAGVFPSIGIMAARCVLCAGLIISLPLIFPYFFSLLNWCKPKLDNCLEQERLKFEATRPPTPCLDAKEKQVSKIEIGDVD